MSVKNINHELVILNFNNIIGRVTSMEDGIGSSQGFGVVANWSPFLTPPAVTENPNFQYSYPNSFQPEHGHSSNFGYPMGGNCTTFPHSNSAFPSLNHATMPVTNSGKSTTTHK